MFARSHPFLSKAVCVLGVLPLLVLAACSSDKAAAPTTASSSTSVSTSTTTATSVAPSTASVEPPPATTQAPPTTNPLTGGEVSGNAVIAAKIDNTNFGGLQFGTADADIVYVEMVEGGLTRLLAVFHSVLPEEVGPIRSVRSTDSELLPTFGAPGLVFSGGNEGTLGPLASSTVVDASQAAAGSAYWRSAAGSGTHNLHANIAQIPGLVPGISAPNSPGFTFGADYPAMAGGRDVSSLNVQMTSPVRFSFEGGAYVYNRQGEVSVDANSGATIQIQNLLVQRVTAEPDGIVDANGSPSFFSHTVGSGAFTLYRDGKAIDGSWTRAAVDGPTSYVDGAGAPVLFKPGKTWVMLAPANATISEG